MPATTFFFLSTLQTHLVMIDKIKHGHHVQKDTRVPRVARRHALHVVCELGGAVDLLARFDAVHHFAHVAVDFALVFCYAVEADCFLESRGGVRLAILCVWGVW